MKVKTQGRIENAQVIIAPSFGMRKKVGELGVSNEAIAEIIVDIAGYFEKKIPVIAQKEVADALSSLKYTNIVGVIKEHWIRGKYLNTSEVLLQTHGIMKKNRWDKAIAVAHPAHISCVKGILEKMGVEVIIPEELEGIPFDPLSTQWWTRGRLRWWLREIPTSLIYKIKGWT